jgi:hypothetical protein
LADYPAAQARLIAARFADLPLVLIHGRVAHSDSYPSREQLCAMLQMTAPT